MNKLDWKLKKEVGEIVLTAGGTIFGGYIRDSIIHDHYAKLYYEKCDEDKVSEDDIDDKYTDPTFYPEYSDRTVVPEDIDCFFPSMLQLKTFEFMLIQNKYCCKRLFTRSDASEYLPRLKVDKKMLSHVRYLISLVNPNKVNMIRMLIQQSVPAAARYTVNEEIDIFLHLLESRLEDATPIIVDALIVNDNHCSTSTQQYMPPFGDLDFECNSLLLTKLGLTLAEDLKEKQIKNGFITDLNKLFDIQKDILQKKAKIVCHYPPSPTDKYRVTKMINKGWTIIHDHFQIILKVPQEDTCIICHNTFNTEEDCYKLKCCAAKYHKKCLIDASLEGSAAMTVKKECIMCKQHVCTLAHDIAILQSL